MFNEIENHTHNGVNSSKIRAKDLTGFPVFLATPTHKAKQGTIVLVDNGTDTREICAMLGGTWYCVAIT